MSLDTFQVPLYPFIFLIEFLLAGEDPADTRRFGAVGLITSRDQCHKHHNNRYRGPRERICIFDWRNR
jgi:hypothetical protein